MSNKGKLIIFSAPSGSGKTTLVKHLREVMPELEFSVSATSRQPREGEVNGVDYHFISPDTFREKIQQQDFLEWEEVYVDKYYGTLKSEVDKALAEGRHIILDVDVKGGINIKRVYGDRALALFIVPPSIEALRERLVGRGTDTLEIIKDRVAKAEYELSHSEYFDVKLVNDSLEQAKVEVVQVISNFLS